MEGLFVQLNPRQVTEAVDLALREAIAKELSRDPDALVKAVIEAALSSRGTGYGSTHSMFKTELDKVIREEALKALTATFEEERPRINAELRRRITAELLTDAVLAQTIDKLQGIYVTVGAVPPVDIPAYDDR